ncbi:K(+) efflux antiporter 2, chloroplastic-like protein [Drosera capensis]
MEAVCGFRPSVVFGSGSECKRCGAAEFSGSRYGNRTSVLRCKYLGASRMVSRKGILLSTGRSVGGYQRLSSASCFRRGSSSDLHVLLPRNFGVVGCRNGNGLIASRCQGNDSVVYVNGHDQKVRSEEDYGEEVLSDDVVGSLETDGNQDDEGEEGLETPSLENLRDLLQKALRELEVARLNSAMFEEKAQKISEAAISLKDKAADARNDVDATIDFIEEVVKEEAAAKEAVQKATMAFSLADARLQVAVESVEAIRDRNACLDGSLRTESVNESEEEAANLLKREEEALLVAQEEIKFCRCTLESCEAELKRFQNRKDELQKEVDRLNEVAVQVRLNALKAEEDVADIMLLAEQAVAFEVEAAQRVSDATIALQRAESSLVDTKAGVADIAILQNAPSIKADVIDQEEIIAQVFSGDNFIETGGDLVAEDISLTGKQSPESHSDKSSLFLEDYSSSDNLNGKEAGKSVLESTRASPEVEIQKNTAQTKKLREATQKENSPFSVPKALLKKSSRFFSASFFSFAGDGSEFAPASVFHEVVESGRKNMPKLIAGLLLLGAGMMYQFNRSGRLMPLHQQVGVATSIEDVSSDAKPLVQQIQKLPKRLKKFIQKLPQQEINEEEASLFDVLWLLLASVIFVPLFQKIPGGSPVLGYLTAGILIGPYGLSIIRHVHGTKAIAEFGVVFLLFNIGLELSVERLSSMKKYVFGLGSAQVLTTAAVVGLVAHFLGQPGPAAIVIGNGLALSSTAVVLQVLQERGESTSRHGRATFSVLLFQVGFQAIAEALGMAAVKAIVAIAAIVAGGRLLLRPIYKQIAENQNAEIFSANTLLVILGTSLLTARAGLSMALGAFLAGLLLAETEFSLQVESDIAPYRGLLLGLFFMTVGMSIDPKLLISNFPVVMGNLGLLIVGKTALVAFVGKLFGLSVISAIRVGLLLAPGGEFAFVAFGEAVNQGIISPQLSSLLFLVVGISMALTPWLAAGGQLIASRFELQDVRSLLPVESETDDLQDHIIICGFGRVGQIIAQLLSERLIPFVALDVRSDRVAIGRALDLPVFFGDAGSREVLHKVGAERACAAAVTLDTPGSNYRTVWALNKYYPNVKTFVRAHDVDHGLNLEKAGATAVVPETLEPSLQLAAAVLAQAKMPMSEIASTINEFRSRHLSELTELCEASGSCLGYGYSRPVGKPKSQSSDSSDESDFSEETLAI